MSKIKAKTGILFTSSWSHCGIYGRDKGCWRPLLSSSLKGSYQVYTESKGDPKKRTFIATKTKLFWQETQLVQGIISSSCPLPSPPPLLSSSSSSLLLPPPLSPCLFPPPFPLLPFSTPLLPLSFSPPPSLFPFPPPPQVIELFLAARMSSLLMQLVLIMIICCKAKITWIHPSRPTGALGNYRLEGNRKDEDYGKEWQSRTEETKGIAILHPELGAGDLEKPRLLKVGRPLTSLPLPLDCFMWGWGLLEGLRILKVAAK